jgi:hypothetical protein
MDGDRPGRRVRYQRVTLRVMSGTTEKRKAKRLLTKFIREIADEIYDEPIITGKGIDDAKVVTKAEALARYIWKCALGYKETVDIMDKESGRKLGTKEVINFPDKKFIDIVLERLEGKVPNVVEKMEDQKATVADRVSGKAKDRLNKLAI